MLKDPFGLQPNFPSPNPPCQNLRGRDGKMEARPGEGDLGREGVEGIHSTGQKMHFAARRRFRRLDL